LEHFLPVRLAVPSGAVFFHFDHMIKDRDCPN
jgi:hypothetical protein